MTDVASKGKVFEELKRRFASNEPDALLQVHQQQLATYRKTKQQVRLLAQIKASEMLDDTSFETVCLVCGAPMVAQRSTKLTCSDKCRQTWARVRRERRREQPGGDLRERRLRRPQHLGDAGPGERPVGEERDPRDR